jgi:DNA repair exonuclease SbcCD nuclease subunit
MNASPQGSRYKGIPVPRFLHTADWQIGRQYSQFSSDDALPIAEARLEAVQTIARLASEHAVDAVLVAGDVFDAQTVAERTIRKLFNAMQGFAGPWIMIPGNHDAALTESVWTQARRLGALPGNLHLALQGTLLEFPSLNFAALCAPLTQRHTYNDLTAPFDDLQTPDGMLRIGLAHGSVQGILAEDIDSANPIAPDRARRARLDYLALGDWHGCKQIDSRTWYSGTPEQDRFKGNEAGFALLVQIDAPGAEPLVTRLATGKYVWQAWQQSLSVTSDADELIAKLDAVGPRDVLHVTLTGQTDLSSQQEILLKLSHARARARSLEVDLAGLRLLPTAQDIGALKADGYLGEVIAELRDLQGTQASEEDRGVATHALGLLTTLLAERQATGAQA